MAPKLVFQKKAVNKKSRLWGQVAHMVTFVGCNGSAADNTRHNGDMEIADWSRRTMINVDGA